MENLINNSTVRRALKLGGTVGFPDSGGVTTIYFAVTTT
jgi:hypothetical protein